MTGRTALHFAAQWDHFKLIDRLLTMQPTLAMEVDDDGKDAMDVALQESSIGAMQAIGKVLGDSHWAHRESTLIENAINHDVVESRLCWR